MTSIPVPHPDASPGTHALIIGVSDYPFADGPNASALGASFELENLTTAARSASEVAAWLRNEYCNPDVPLASLRVLLSPAAGESIHPDIAADLSGPAPATRAAVEAELRQFRYDCRRNPQNAAFVYIAGHGIQLNKRGAVVLLHDFGDPTHLNEPIPGTVTGPSVGTASALILGVADPSQPDLLATGPAGRRRPH